jgi:signal transduction histidine kinase
VTVATITLCGWLAAGIAAGGAVVTRRSLGLRMEAVARACHELRGPLTAARLGLALGVRGGELSPAQLRALDLELARAALALDDLASARAPLREVRGVQAVDVGGLLADSVEAWRPAADAVGGRLELQWSGGPAHVIGNRLRLAQATGNLIANAVEHGGGVVIVRGGATVARRGNVAARGRTEGALVRVEVLDGGPGLPAPVPELTRRHRGGDDRRGRGLAIAESIARDHGGRLAAAPCQRGARLLLELPVAAGSPAPGLRSP